MSKEKLDEQGVTIITCTNKLQFMENLITNFVQQKWENKELIIILNKDTLNLEEWRERTKEYIDVSIFQLPEEVSLGSCLNYGVEKSKYNFIAKFDDDDYYGPSYIDEAMDAFAKTDADVIGKRSYFIYLEINTLLMIRFPKNENRWVKRVHGGTIIAKKRALEKVPFPDRSLGEDKYFLRNCLLNGLSIYSTSRFNYTYIRREQDLHTWKANKRYLYRTSKTVAITSNFKPYTNPFTDST
ncbi:glycosyltransferase [Bacillus dakarensis]|uniref:glycosyltransferase n=1 Tax=Robertmurraya dakarensis TaxID=1926278 RepID=UPI0009816B2B|nr:glycosyltransferase [Bacillus dakarensis]